MIKVTRRKNSVKCVGLTPRHVYGPVPSRRLGFSLGVDILPYKTCSLNCIYCQLGPTPRTTARRGAFFSKKEILKQIKEVLDSGTRVDHITFSGSGEPTLNRSIGPLIKAIKKMTPVPVAVLTNATLLSRKPVRESLLGADVVVPSLDAATPELFRKVNRPNPSLKVGKMVEGLRAFRREFKGKIWLEIMLVKDINDSRDHIRKLARAVAAIKPDRVHLNTVVRPPAEKYARPLTTGALQRIQREIGADAEIAADFKKTKQTTAQGSTEEAILAMVRRRPVTAKEIAASLGKQEAVIRRSLSSLLRWRRIRQSKHKGRIYFRI